jgi:hypothetical protein
MVGLKRRIRHRNMDQVRDLTLLLRLATLIPARATMTVDESKALKKDTRVYWRGNAADSGIITETSWDAVTIAWNNGELARVHHGDMREIQKTPTTPHNV